MKHTKIYLQNLWTVTELAMAVASVSDGVYVTMSTAGDNCGATSQRTTLLQCSKQANC